MESGGSWISRRHLGMTADTTGSNAAREAARSDDGKFGIQPHGRPEQGLALVKNRIVLNEVTSGEDLEETIMQAAASLNTPDKHASEGAEWAIERRLNHLETDEALEHVTKISAAKSQYGDMSIPLSAAIADAVAANDEARTAKGIGTVDPTYAPPGQVVVAGGYGPNPTKGDRHSSDWRSVTDIAKDCRSELKTAVKAGYLPDLDYRVTTDKYSGGQSMRVVACGLTDDQLLETGPSGRAGYTKEALELQSRLRTISNAWNKDESDVQTDYFSVLYYAQVSLESERERDWRLEESARKAARRKKTA